MTEAAPAPLFDRVMLASLAPAPLLAALAPVVSIATSLLRESITGVAAGVESLVLAVYCFVLLGSMALNGWLLLRHPGTLATGAATRGISISLAVLQGSLLLWIVLLAIGIPGELSVAFGALLALLSIVVFALAIGRYARPGASLRLQTAELPPWGRALAIGYVVVAALVLLFAVASPFIGVGWTDSAGVIGGPTTWALLILGLPWSHPLYFIAVVLLFTVGSGLGAAATIIPTLLVGLATVANLALVIVVLVSPAKRAAIANWFFRLGKQTAAQAEPAPPIA